MIFGEGEADEAMVDLYREFLEDGEKSLAKIRGISPSADREALRSEAHKLKGSASNFGFARLSEILAEIENGAAALSAEDCGRLVGEAEDAFAYSRRQVVGRYPSLES